MSLRLKFEVEIDVKIPSDSDLVRASEEECDNLKDLILDSLGYPEEDRLGIKVALLEKVSYEKDILARC